VKEFADPEEMAELFNEGATRITALERSFRARLRIRSRPGLGVLESTLPTRFTTEGSVDPNAGGIMLVLENPHEARQEGEVLRAGEILVYGPEAGVFAHGRGVVSLQLGMPARELARQLRALLRDEAPDLAGRRFRIRLRQEEARRLEGVLRHALEHAPTDQIRAPSGAHLPLDARHVVSSVCEIVAGGWPSRMRPPALRRDRERILRAATDLLQASRGTVDLTSLCEHLGVSAETIRLVFREAVGLPPMRFAKLRRLHEARELLKRADPRADNVKSIAMRCGFTHLGRFSIEYREIFGERPSDTFRGC
jgi:AraC-like DNA-binding protein